MQSTTFLEGYLCFRGFEILLFVAGLLSIITGKIPSSLFAVLFGKGQYQAARSESRQFGYLLASPFPLATASNLILSSQSIAIDAGDALFAEGAALLLVCLVASRMARAMKLPGIQPAEAEEGAAEAAAGETEEAPVGHPSGVWQSRVRLFGWLIGFAAFTTLAFYAISWILANPGHPLSDVLVGAVVLLLLALPLIGMHRGAKLLRRLSRAIKRDLDDSL